jgi:hypothetical protein
MQEHTINIGKVYDDCRSWAAVTHCIKIVYGVCYKIIVCLDHLRNDVVIPDH